MEFQIANEISTFWGTLVPPMLLGLLSLLMFGWVIGKENRNYILMHLSESDSSTFKYVLQKGIYIPRNQTTKSIFLRNIAKRFGFESMKPLIAVFFVVLLFFGLNQILLQIFQPMITYASDRLIYACGVDDYLIANIWMYYPHIASSDQLYAIIIDLTKETQRSSGLLQYSVEAFVRFDLICCVVMFFRMIFTLRKSRWVNCKVFIRLFTAIIILFFILIGTLFSNIQQINDEARYRCYEAYAILEKQHDVYTDVKISIQSDNFDTYLAMVEQDRDRYGQDLYYGAFDIRNGLVESITNAVREFYRFFNRISCPHLFQGYTIGFRGRNNFSHGRGQFPHCGFTKLRSLCRIKLKIDNRYLRREQLCSRLYCICQCIITKNVMEK